MAQLPCIGLSRPLTKPPFGSCAMYFHYGTVQKYTVYKPISQSFNHCSIDLSLDDFEGLLDPLAFPGCLF